MSLTLNRKYDIGSYFAWWSILLGYWDYVATWQYMFLPSYIYIYIYIWLDCIMIDENSLGRLLLHLHCQNPIDNVFCMVEYFAVGTMYLAVSICYWH